MNSQQEFDNRLAKVRQTMREKGLQTLLVFESGRHNFLRMNYVAYLTTSSASDRKRCWCCHWRTSRRFFCRRLGTLERAKEESWVKDVQPVKDLWNRLANNFRERRA